MFRKLKSYLRGTRFRDDDEIKAATEAWLGTKQTPFISKAYAALKKSGPTALK